MIISLSSCFSVEYFARLYFRGYCVYVLRVCAAGGHQFAFAPFDAIADDVDACCVVERCAARYDWSRVDFQSFSSPNCHPVLLV